MRARSASRFLFDSDLETGHLKPFLCLNSSLKQPPEKNELSKQTIKSCERFLVKILINMMYNLVTKKKIGEREARGEKISLYTSDLKTGHFMLFGGKNSSET